MSFIQHIKLFYKDIKNYSYTLYIVDVEATIVEMDGVGVGYWRFHITNTQRIVHKMLGMRLTENQQLQCSAAPAPLQRSVARALAATAHYVDSVDTRQTSGTWTPPTLCCWMEAPLYINLPISIASHCHCAARHGPALCKHGWPGPECSAQW